MDRYEEALERAKQGKPIEEVFPEIGEERTQELLHSCVCRAINDPNLSYDMRNEISSKVIPYLEKQKEQKVDIDKFRKGIYQSGYSDGYQHGKEDAQKEQKPVAEKILTKAGLKPFKDGNQWCILAGDNIQEGVCGFGDTIEDALYEFLKEICKQKTVEWSEEDKENAAYIGAALEAYYKLRKKQNNTSGQTELDRAKEWLYNRFKFLCPQPKQESEPIEIKYAGKIYKVYGTKELPGGVVVGYIIEDEPGHYDCITSPDEVHYNIKGCGSPYPTKEANFGQSHWKPSEEQMKALSFVKEYFKGVPSAKKEYKYLIQLYDDLEKLL